MIHYTLHCANRHEFAGWFKNSVSFDQQSELGLLECPICGDTHVSRALMTPAVVKPRAEPVSVPAAQAFAPTEPRQVASATLNAAQIPAQVLSGLQRLRAAVEKHCDYVGAEFPDVARSIHRGETGQRGIYGEATPEEAESLADEGIHVTPIPWVPRADG